MKTAKENRLVDELEIGKWKVSPEYGILASPGGKTLLLEPRLSKLNYLLYQNANSIVPRQYLIDNIWPDTIVNEESLTRAVADLRKTLSSNFDNLIQVDTIHKRGYKLNLQKAPQVVALKLKLNKTQGYLALLALAISIILWIVI